MLNKVFHVKQTIFALASAQGRAGVAVVRISGERACGVLQALIGCVPSARIAVLKKLFYKEELIDQALVLYFPAPNSFTGEDCVELQLHGSRAVLDRTYQVLCELGLRHAQAGEFSRRAFENGKLDLTQAEAISDLVEAETQAQRHQALKQLDGALKDQYIGWRDRLTAILAHIEVLIDFPDEDIPHSVKGKVLGDIGQLRNELEVALAQSKHGQQIREGYRIAIIGRPNAGKSTLFNALLRNETAIVTPIAGTTRDVIEAQIRLGGHSALIYDTAGLHETQDIVEAEGIRRALIRAQTADLRLWVINAQEGAMMAKNTPQANDFIIINKTDLVSKDESLALVRAFDNDLYKVFTLNMNSKSGLTVIEKALEETVRQALSAQTFPAATRARHIERLREVIDCLSRALSVEFKQAELCAEDLRQAISSFDLLFGKQDVERVLDHIFSSFCIGK